MAAAQDIQVDMTNEINQAFGQLPMGRGIRGCTRICDLHPLLREQYRVPLKAAMKATAEEHHVLHRDAYNLLNLHIRRFLENNDQHPFAAEPPITAQVLWAWAYKYVNYPANHPEEVRVPDRGQYIQQIIDLRNTYLFYFRPLQLDNEQQALYESPQMSSTLENIMAERFARQAIQNVKEMLQRNIPGYIERVCKAYLVQMDIASEANWDLFGQYKPLIRVMVDSILENDPEGAIPLQIQQAGIQGFIDMYQDIRQQLNDLLPDVDLVEMATGHSRGLPPGVAMNIVRFSGWLLNQGDFLDARRWSLLPMPSMEIGFYHIDRRVLWVILKRAHEANPGFLPNEFTTPRGRMIPLAVFENMFNTARQQEILWETFFNLDHVQKRRWRYQGARQLVLVHLPGTPIRFGNHIVTDGHSCRVYFQRPAPENEPPFLPDTMGKVNMLPREVDLDNVQTGVYVLNKEPGGLDAQRLAGARIVGVDPGKRELVTAIAHEDDLRNLDHGRRDTVIEVPARHYQHVTQIYWNYQVEENLRNKAQIQDVYTDLSQHTGLIPDVNRFQQRIATLSQHSNRLVDFATHWRHRQKRRFLISARQSYQQQIINEIRGISPALFPQEPVHRMHTTGKSERRIARRLIRRNMGWVRPEGETIVAYGNAVLGHMRTFAPMPHWGFIEKLAREVLVVFINEFRTSVRCHHCGAPLQLLYNNFLTHCTHKKKKLRHGFTATGNRRHKNTFCLDDEGNVIGITTMCPQAGPVAGNHWRNLVYALKACPVHGILGRDVNAAANMRSVLRLYIETNGDLNSRPDFLQH